MKSLCIIGTAGRGDDGKRFAEKPLEYWDTMMRAARRVREVVDAQELVSGGAAISDNIAVNLFFELLSSPDECHLRLELPAPLALKGNCLFLEDAARKAQWKAAIAAEGFPPKTKMAAGVGAVANSYHRKAAALLGTTPQVEFAKLRELSYAKPPLVTLNVHEGFFARNAIVAQADCLLAMTFGDKHAVADGGTKHTVARFLARPDHGDSYHLDLNTGKLYKGCTL